MNIPDEAIVEAIKVLDERDFVVRYPRVSDYVNSDMTDEERNKGLVKLKLADFEIESKQKEIVKAALEAAIEKLPGLCSGCHEVVNGAYCGYCSEN